LAGWSSIYLGHGFNNRNSPHIRHFRLSVGLAGVIFSYVMDFKPGWSGVMDLIAGNAENFHPCRLRNWMAGVVCTCGMDLIAGALTIFVMSD
jgi:hypothetical protein